MRDTTSSTRTAASASGESRRKLFVCIGSEATEHELPESGAVVIGRESPADIVIHHPTLSRRHAKLTVGDHVTVEDLGSRNGTVVGGRKLGPGQVVLVSAGSTIELGDALLVLRTGRGEADMLGTSEGGVSGADALERKLGRIAKTDVFVVVAGESGAGKRFVAERIHALSARAAAPFIELRAHPALTVPEIAAAVAAARGGTLLLREPSELARGQQLALLNAIGAPGALRIVTATTTELAASDAVLPELRTRLAELTIVVPPLRARIRELPAIVEAVVQSVAQEQGRPTPLVSADALTFLGRQPWPNNVRELRNAVTQAMVLGKGRVLTATHFAAETDATPGVGDRTLSTAVNDLEHRRIIEALRECRGNQSQAARMLGIARGTLISRLKLYAIPPRSPK